MIEQELQRKIADFRELGMPAYVAREGKIHLVNHMVSTVIGARRSGKSYRVFQAADELIQQGVITSMAHVCPVDFDNPILGGMSAKDLHQIEGTFLKVSPEFGLKTPLVFILDEIHRVPGWEDYVIDLSRNPHWKVMVTGSSSKLLRDDIGTALRGKAVSSTVYPLSFSEFLRFKKSPANAASTTGRAEIQAQFDDYLKWGGYPALPSAPEHSREALLRGYFDSMILKDIVQRFNVSKPRQCTELYGYLLSMIGRPCTLKSGYEFLQQAGHTTSRDAVRDYLAWAEDAWLLFSVFIHSDSQKEQERNYRKIYAIDWALAICNSRVWDGSYSRAFENMVCLHLLRNYPRVRYYLTRTRRQEVDFLVSDAQGKPVLAIQVSQDISLPDTLRREVEPLIATARHFGTKENLILTMSQEQRLESEGVTVQALPAWRWLMSTP
ncbi:MAG: ATP-binding protein [Lentisphaeria bacterium]